MSLRSRLLLLTMALLTAGLAISNVVVIGSLRSHLVSRLDAQLSPMAGLLSDVSPTVFADSDDGPRLLDLAGRLGLLDDSYAAYLGPDGSVQRVVRAAAGERRPAPELPRLDTAAVAAHGGHPFEVRGRERSDRWRVVAILRSGGSAEAGSVVVAASLREVNATIERVLLTCVLIGGSVILLLSVAGLPAVRAGLRPLHRIEETATAIAGGDLARRVPDLADPGTEVGQLAAALNGMLSQIEKAFASRADSEARMRRFVADASHELRTPLSGIKGFAQLYRMGGLPERADVDRTIIRIEDESTRLARLVDDLLLLAQLDERTGTAAPPLQIAPMDLRTLAVDALHDLRVLDPARAVSLTGPAGGPPTGAPVLGDEARLRQVVTNLIGNAVAHTRPGTPVRIGVGTVGEHAVLEIEDCGPGLTAEQAERVFERFHRVDGSRTRTARGGGAGLGLAIVHSVVTAHDGHVDLRTSPAEGSTFRVMLPAV